VYENEVNEKLRAERKIYGGGEVGKRVPGGDTQCDQMATAPAMSEDYALNELFSYHPPFGDANLRYENIRSAAKQFAKVVLINVPHGADRTAAIRKIREAVMTANAGVALNGFSL
jgi:hypothetical protein